MSILQNKDKLLQKFQDRGVATEKLVFIDWVDQKQYRYLLQRSYLMLDSLGFSGINTVLQALHARLPVVTERGEFLRSRLGSGVLDAVGMAHWVADTPASYISQVCELVQNASAYAQYQADLRQAEAQLFGNTSCIAEFFEIFRRLHRERNAALQEVSAGMP